MSKFLLPTPDGQTIRDLHERLVAEWDGRIALDLEWRDIIHQKNAIEMLPESSDRNIKSLEIHTGRAGGIVDHANGLLMAMPGVHVDPTTLNTLDAREAEQVERVCMAMFQKHLLANDFWSSVGRDLLIYARSFIKAMPLPSVWTAQEGYPVRKFEEKGSDYLKRIIKWKETEGKFPFVISHVSALAILPMLDNHDNVLASIEEKWVIAKVIAEEFNDAEVQELIKRKSLNWYDEIPVIEYIDSQHVAYALAGTTPRNRRDSDVQLFHGVGSYRLLRTWTHGLGKNPIVMITGIKTEMNDYEDHFKGFMHDAKDALLLYDVLISRLATMVYAYYLPSYEWQLTSTSAQFAGHDRPQLKVNLGGVTVTYADEQLRPLQPATGLPDADQLLKHTDDIIQRHTLEDVLFGRVAGTAPAFQVSLRINVAKSKLTPIAQHMAQGLTNVFELFLRGVINLGEKVIISGEEISPKMAEKYKTRIAVTIQPKSPQERGQDIGSAKMALEIGLPWDWVVENLLDIEDPATLRMKKDIQDLEELPPVKERLMGDALTEMEALIQQNDYTDIEGIDYGSLPPEFAQAIQSILGSTSGEQASKLEGLLSGQTKPGIDTSGVGRGPFPEGAAPQSLSPRGLLTEKTQPAPGSSEVDLGLLGVPGGG